MTNARTSLEHHTSAAGRLDQAAQHHHGASKLFERDHAYAARLVQIATAIRSGVRSTTTVKPDPVPSEIEGDDRITAGIVTHRRPTGPAHRQARGRGVDARAGVGIGFADERQELAAPPKPSVPWRRCDTRKDVGSG
jgi:hypothetical protein